MTEEEIRVDEDEIEEENGASEWVEEMKVTGDELLDTVKGLVTEAGVRRIVILNKNGKVLLEIPLVLGLAGIALLPVYSAVALFAALVADCTILVERSGEKPAEDE
ncbi:MAG: DUF4342 domain-containing protein [Candidatus Promineifilaceae bacterium]|jgi:hypothetical protein